MKKLLILVIISLAILVRTYDFNTNPPGFYVDEAGIGYNAFSISQTGMDEYGKQFPLLFKSFGDFKLPLYPYLTVVSVKIFGLTVFATRLISLLAGLLLVIITMRYLGLLTALIIAISPVFVFFSRGAFEANLALFLFIFGVFLSVQAKKSLKLLPFAFLLLSISAYAYHTERLLSFIMIAFFTWMYWSNKTKKALILSIILAVIVQIPLLTLSFNHGASIRLLGLTPDGTLIEKTITSIKQYLNYFSPNNLFSKPDPDVQRSFPELSVFYWWMFIPFVFGVWRVIKRKNNLNLMEKTSLFLLLVSPLTGAITNDYFSSLRVLPMFIVISWIISVGFRFLIGNKKLLYIPIVAIALIELYSNLVLLKHERSSVWGYEYKELASFTNNTNEPILIDSSRKKPIYILLAFYNKLDPTILQSETDDVTRLNYYDSTSFVAERKIKNIEIRPINWKTDIYKDQLIVADNLAVSESQAKEHELKLIKQMRDINGDTVLNVYKTNPEEKKRSNQKTNNTKLRISG